MKKWVMKKRGEKVKQEYGKEQFGKIEKKADNNQIDFFTIKSARFCLEGAFN